MNTSRALFSVMLAGVLRRVRSGQSLANDALILAAILEVEMFKAGNVDITDYLFENIFIPKEREEISNLIIQYQGVLDATQQ